MDLLKQSTAATIKMGPFLDDTDGKTAETGLTIAQADIRLTKNGGAYAQSNNAAGATHDEGGEYGVPLDTTDTGTLGRLKVRIHVSGALPVWKDFLVVPANVYDALVLGTDYLQVDEVQISGDGTAADNAEAFFDGTGYAGTNNVIPTVTAVSNGVTLANDAITAAKFDETTAFPLAAADSGATQVARVGADGDTLETLSDQIDAVVADTNELQTDLTNGGRLDLLIDAILADTNELQTDLTDGGRLDLLIDAIVADTNELQTAGDADATTSLTLEEKIIRIYRFLMNKMNITDATGAVALRNEADGADIATQTITDNDTTTVRTAVSWS